jgi:hypothetical protein
MGGEAPFAESVLARQDLRSQRILRAHRAPSAFGKLGGAAQKLGWKCHLQPSFVANVLEDPAPSAQRRCSPSPPLRTRGRLLFPERHAEDEEQKNGNLCPRSKMTAGTLSIPCPQRAPRSLEKRGREAPRRLGWGRAKAYDGRPARAGPVAGRPGSSWAGLTKGYQTEGKRQGSGRVAFARLAQALSVESCKPCRGQIRKANHQAESDPPAFRATSSRPPAPAVPALYKI